MARGELKKVSALFDKYKERLIAPESTVVSAFLDICSDFGLVIGKDQVRYSPGTSTLSISASGTLRNEIRLREKDFLIHLKGRLGVRNAPRKIL